MYWERIFLDPYRSDIFNKLYLGRLCVVVLAFIIDLLLPYFAIGIS
jgi:hypothetical protein